jgi:alanine racemase
MRQKPVPVGIREPTKRPDIERPTRAVISCGAISHNVVTIRKRIGARRKLLAVVKADGYGHGSGEVSRVALKSGADCLGVALPEEGKRLRTEGIDAPILVLGLIQPKEAYKVVDLQLDQTLCSLDLAEALDQEAASASSRVNVHVKVDTGMGRIGVKPEDVLPFVQRIQRLNHLTVMGIFTHFSSADEADKAPSRRQIEIFDQVIRAVDLSGIKIPIKHMANSAGILDLPESYYDLVRPGIIVYGLYPSDTVSRSMELKPAMTLKTRISYLKTVPPGTAISYGGTFVTQKQTKVATLPVGYGDGYNRLLSGRGQVVIKGRRVPLIGHVCMDMCMIDVSRVPNVKAGDEVILFGDDLSVDEIASLIGTINYEIVCAVGKRVPRIYLR